MNNEATAIFLKCIEVVNEVGNHRNSGTDGGTFIPLVVECVDRIGKGKVYLFAHYSEQNGDLMADPEMTFIVGDSGGV